MKCVTKVVAEILVLTAFVMLCGGVCWGVEPTLARLSIWVPPERMEEFETAFQEKVVPILKRHGWQPAKQRPPANPSIFSRLYEVGNDFDLQCRV